MSKFQPEDIVKYINSKESVIAIIIKQVEEPSYDKEIYRVRIVLHPDIELVGYIDFKHEDNLELLDKEKYDTNN